MKQKRRNTGIAEMHQAEDTAKAAALTLSEKEMVRIEKLTDEMKLDVTRCREKKMK